jgi:acyl-CoA thioesterase-1
MKAIFVFGDSLSAGLGISPREAWPMLLLDKLRPISSHFRVINASASGSTTEDGLHRLPPHLDRPIDIFVLELGSTMPGTALPSKQFAPTCSRSSIR